MANEALSYWQRTTPSIPLSTDLPSSVDVAVIGGGIIGAATCYWLARKGIQTALLERNALAYGASGRNGGFVVAGPAEPYQDAIAHLGHETARAIMQLTYESRTLLRQVLEEEGIQCDYQEPGIIRLALTEQQREHLSEEASAIQADGFSAHFIDREQVQSFIKTPISHEILGGQFVPDQGIVHSAKLVQGLLLAALRRGAQAYHTEVLHLSSHDHHISIHTSTGSLTARTAIVATNIWISHLFPQLKDIIIPWREQMLAYAPIEPVFTTGISADLNTAEYWRQTPDGTILIGGCGNVEEEKSLGSWESQPTAKVQHAIEQIIPRLFPKLPPLQVTQRWAGLLDCTADNFPIVDQIPEMPGVYMVAGFSGHGMPFAMRFGQLLAATAKDESLAPELHPYRFNRPTLKKWHIHTNSDQ
jgi:gamma-glutamylputrescine oxidase